jgi:hypothetical protein
MQGTVDLRGIHPHGGDRRRAFEQLSWLLFARANVHRGLPQRREGAGGDAGLEGALVDGEGHAIVGVQAKFYTDKLESTQWRNLDSSIRTALGENAVDGLLEEIVVTLPRELTPAQLKKWEAYREAWQTEAARLQYRKAVRFTLWGEAALLDLLLRSENRGLLLHYFEVPDFDRERCCHKTRATIRALGDRYQPDLHTPTEAEDQLHTFLRSERCREQFLEEGRNCVHERWRLRNTGRGGWPAQVQELHAAAEVAWERVFPLFGDGLHLPVSFTAVATGFDAVAEAQGAIVEALLPLIPPRKRSEDEEYGYSPGSRHPLEEALETHDRWRDTLRRFADFMRKHATADSPCMLLTGDPGTGKTHVLAEVCLRFAEQGGVVLFTEGAAFPGTAHPWSQFLRWADFPGGGVRDFLATISTMALPTGLPALICIDALNETPDRNLWRNGLENFTAELEQYENVKLLVSCRRDYLRQTLPEQIRKKRSPHWVIAEHQGLGGHVFDALPKYLRAYDVRGIGIPPLAHEFRVPLFLRVFCEAYSGQSPEPGVFSLSVILRHYATRKAGIVGQRIDCDPGRVLSALRDLGAEMERQGLLQLPEQQAQDICQRHHAPTESSKSLYRALLAENILLEFPGETDLLGATNLVRFTYERVWDYFLSLYLLPAGTAPSDALLAKLSGAAWREGNRGAVSLLTVRMAEDGHGELCDLVSAGGRPGYDLIECFVESLPWRTAKSVSPRTRELFVDFASRGWIGHELQHVLPVAPNPAHPWNADWRHGRLAALPLPERDQKWTFWVNDQFLDNYSDSPLRELLNWAEHGHIDLLPDEQVFLLGTALAWCLSTTVVDARIRLASALTRLLAGRVRVASKLVTRFFEIDDPYVRERVLLAAAGVAQHASSGDPALGDLAAVVHAKIFCGKSTEPHLLIRHYASEICRQAEMKSILPDTISPASFKPPFRSNWPRIWSDKAVQRKRKQAGRGHTTLFESVEPGPGFGYGDFGRYVMEGLVHHFQARRLKQKPITGERSSFDAQVAKRYILQRVFGLGWDANSTDVHPTGVISSGSQKTVERLSKKYQWIALYEFLGYLSDHYHFHGYSDHVRPFASARQLGTRDLLDPFVIEPLRRVTPKTWRFTPAPRAWWNGGMDPLPYALSPAAQCYVASEREASNPVTLLDLCHEGERWIALSSFHIWDEPIPIWIDPSNTPRVHFEWAVRSYLVKPERFSRLIRCLSQRSLSHSTMWLQEPEFGQPLAALRTYPANQERLKERCQLDELWETESWKTGAFCSTCRCATDEEHRRAREGSMPSPQIAELGNLRWLGTAFDFGAPEVNTPLIRHVGEGFKGACVVRREALLSWLAGSGLRLVWRCYGFKYRLHEHGEGNHARAYWSAFALAPTGAIECHGGATCDFPDGPGGDEPLPWTVAQSATQ